MNCSFKWLIFWCTAILLLVGGCKKSTPANKQNHFIKQTNHVHEDNVNGRTPPPNNVIESTNFYYNEDGTLQQATVYSDTTTSSTLLKKIDFKFYIAFGALLTINMATIKCFNLVILSYFSFTYWTYNLFK